MRPTVFAFDSACSEWQFGEQSKYETFDSNQ